MHFDSPSWFAALGALPALVLFLVWADKRKHKSWQAFVAPQLQRKLVRIATKGRRWIVRGLLTGAAAFFILALARPQFGSEARESAVSGRQVLFAVDISRSMLTRDVQPSRLDFAKVTALELIDSLPEERIGLAAFASEAFLLSPLTIDHEAIREAAAELDPELLPRKGSNLNQLIELTLRTFRRSAAESKLLVIFSDGEGHNTLDPALLADLENQKIRVVSFGVGTLEGGMVPINSQSDVSFTTSDGAVVRSAYDGSQLEELATASKGSHLHLSPGQTALPSVLKALEDIENSPGESRFREVPIERFHWFLLPGMLLAGMGAFLANASSKRPAATSPVALLAFCLILAAPNAKADWPGADEKRAINAFAQASEIMASDPTQAKTLFGQVLLSPNLQHQQLASINLAHLTLQEAADAMFARDAEGKPAPTLSGEALGGLITDAEGHLQNAASIPRAAPDSLGQHQRWAKRLREKLRNLPEPPTPPRPKEGGNPDSPDPDKDNSNKSPGDGAPPKDPKNSRPNDGTNDNSENPESGEPPKPPENSPQEPDLTPRPGETPEEQARRILKSHSDLRGPKKRKPHPLGFKPEKDW